jgi:hypothetical protein
MFLFALAACGPGLSIASTNGACPSSESVAIGAVVWRLDAGIQTPVHFSLISNHIALPA